MSYAVAELVDLMIEVAHFFINSSTKSTSFHVLMMYMFAKRLSKELRAVLGSTFLKTCFRFRRL